MKNQLLIILGKTLSRLIQLGNLGNGSTWPGHIALSYNPKFISELLKKSKTKVIFVVGTNGKTTTTALISHLLSSTNHTVIQNTSGANLINGIASTLLLATNFKGKIQADYALFEVDENTFTEACAEITPDMIVMLNLFRDQLDRYGEVHTIAHNWKKVIDKLPASKKLVLNADDPQIAYLGMGAMQRISYFGLNEDGVNKLDHASDSIYCPVCKTKLKYKKSYYSHLGDWTCPKGDFKHPVDIFSKSPHYPLNGVYNRYNTLAALLAVKNLGINADDHLKDFRPAFGRQEQLVIEGKRVEIILAKNPAGFNQTLQTVLEQKAANILLALNDRIADGTDVSWIWDVDFENLINKSILLTTTGDRAYDLALRLKYAGLSSKIELNLSDALSHALSQTKKSETLYILPTYTAMLEIRKLLVGKKIL